MFGLIDYMISLVRRGSPLPLAGLKHWKPIKIDALGLVTLLGADNVDKSIGTLERRRFTECLPLLAAFVIAGDNFTEEQPGYALYNITDGIYTTELKGWFTRWLSAQRINKATTVFHWRKREESPDFAQVQYIAWAVGFLAVAPLLVCTCLIGDWYGLGNTLAITLSVLVRKFLLWQLRDGLNSSAVPAPLKELPFHNADAEKSRSSMETATQPEEIKKMFVTRADGRMVTIYAPKSILLAFVKDIELPSPDLYHFMRWVGWAAFGAHIVVLGMSTLFTQIYTVVLLVFSTWALCHDSDIDAGRKHSEDEVMQDGTTADLVTIPFTSRLQIKQENPKSIPDRRMNAYIRANPDENQEAMLKHWSLLPFTGVAWYADYDPAKTQFSQKEALLSQSKSTSTAVESASPKFSTLTDSTRSSTLQDDQ